MKILGDIFFSGDSNILNQLQRIEVYTWYSVRSEVFTGVVSASTRACLLGGCDLGWEKNTKHTSGSNRLKH